MHSRSAGLSPGTSICWPHCCCQPPPLLPLVLLLPLSWLSNSGWPVGLVVKPYDHTWGNNA
jgi:hypothetical protein